MDVFMVWSVVDVASAPQSEKGPSDEVEHSILVTAGFAVVNEISPAVGVSLFASKLMGVSAGSACATTNV